MRPSFFFVSCLLYGRSHGDERASLDWSRESRGVPESLHHLLALVDRGSHGSRNAVTGVEGGAIERDEALVREPMKRV